MHSATNFKQINQSQSAQHLAQTFMPNLFAKQQQNQQLTGVENAFQMNDVTDNQIQNLSPVGIFLVGYTYDKFQRVQDSQSSNEVDQATTAKKNHLLQEDNYKAVSNLSNQFSQDTFMPKSWESIERPLFQSLSPQKHCTIENQITNFLCGQEQEEPTEFCELNDLLSEVDGKIVTKSKDSQEEHSNNSLQSQKQLLIQESSSSELMFEFTKEPSEQLDQLTESKNSSSDEQQNLCSINQDSDEQNYQDDSDKIENSDSYSFQNIMQFNQLQIRFVDSKTLQGEKKRKLKNDELCQLYETLSLKRHRSRRTKEDAYHFKKIQLQSSDQTHKQSFNLFTDHQIGINMSNLTSQSTDVENQELLIDSNKDDDLDTDNEIFEMGVEQCFRDLVNLKERLMRNPEYIKRSLRTFQTWAPFFNDQLPFVQRQ